MRTLCLLNPPLITFRVCLVSNVVLMESKQWCYTCLQACTAEDFETGFDCIWGTFGVQSSPDRIKTSNTNPPLITFGVRLAYQVVLMKSKQWWITFRIALRKLLKLALIAFGVLLGSKVVPVESKLRVQTPPSHQEPTVIKSGKCLLHGKNQLDKTQVEPWVLQQQLISTT